MSASAKRSKPRGKKAVPKKAQREKPKKVSSRPTRQEAKPKKAVSKEKKAPEKATPEKPVLKAEPVELGEAPAATVAARHSDSMRERRARGFSFGELASAGVPAGTAKREGLSVDIRRRSVLEGNVELLKGWFKAGDDSKKQMTVAPVSKKK